MLAVRRFVTGCSNTAHRQQERQLALRARFLFLSLRPLGLHLVQSFFRPALVLVNLLRAVQRNSAAFALLRDERQCDDGGGGWGGREEDVR